jgi:hypothetical protein
LIIVLPWYPLPTQHTAAQNADTFDLQFRGMEEVRVYNGERE